MACLAGPAFASTWLRLIARFELPTGDAQPHRRVSFATHRLAAYPSSVTNHPERDAASTSAAAEDGETLARLLGDAAELIDYLSTAASRLGAQSARSCTAMRFGGVVPEALGTATTKAAGRPTRGTSNRAQAVQHPFQEGQVGPVAGLGRTVDKD